jgi:hypothetical protein
MMYANGLYATLSLPHGDEVPKRIMKRRTA